MIVLCLTKSNLISGEIEKVLYYALDPQASHAIEHQLKLQEGEGLAFKLEDTTNE